MRENKQMLAAKMDQQGRTHHVTLMLYPYSVFGIIKEFQVLLKILFLPMCIVFTGVSRLFKDFAQPFADSLLDMCCYFKLNSLLSYSAIL